MVLCRKRTNLLNDMTRLLRGAGISGAPQLLHTVTRQEGRETGGVGKITGNGEPYPILAIASRSLSALS
jgi:hypothetical protein